jgi:hypothetical protein
MGPVVLDARREQIEPTLVDHAAQHRGAIALETGDIDVDFVVHPVIISDPPGRHATVVTLCPGDTADVP